jgi:hypothetical protein
LNSSLIKADTKRYDSDAFVDSVALEIIGNSSRVGWSGRPFTPATVTPWRDWGRHLIKKPSGFLTAFSMPV